MGFLHKTKTELMKIRKMSIKDATWYIWEYYKVSILVAIMALVFFASAIGNWLNPSDIYLNNVIINLPNAEHGEQTLLAQEFRETMMLCEEDVIFEIPLYLFPIDNNLHDNYSVIEKLQIMVAAQEIDLMIMPMADFQALLEMGIYGNLEQILPKDLWADVKDKAIYINDDETGASFPAALDVTNSQAIIKSGFIADSVIICIAGNTQHLQNCANMIEFIFSQVN